ncbi:MAG: carbohydrate-binding domain-containing protein [Bacteroidales bacterium]|nr:carbohydrate-binding domain-containing protein [Bacteroidales bacterium]
MKTTVHAILWSFLLIAAAGCTSDKITTDDTAVAGDADTLPLSAYRVSVEENGGGSSVTVLSSAAWTASVSASWITLGATEGNAGDELSLQVAPNTGRARSARVTIVSEHDSSRLLVSQAGERGGGVLDAGDAEESDDNIARTKFARTVTVTWSGTSVSVEGDENGIVSVSGGDVTVDNTGFDEQVIYELRGECPDGFFKLYSTNKQALVLDGLNLTNPGGAAINNQSKKRTFVFVRETSRLTDGRLNDAGQYPDESLAGDEDLKAAFFSEGQLVFCGPGSLSVEAVGKAGITSDDYVRFMSSPSVSVSASAGHGIRGKDSLRVSGGSLSISVSAAAKKGMSSDGKVIFDGGSTTISVSGGVATVDGELTGSAGIKADGDFYMKDGSLTVTNSGQGGKGISGNGAGYFSGGTVSVAVSGSNYGTSGGGGNPGGGNPGGGNPGGGNNPPPKPRAAAAATSNSKAAKGIKFDGKIVVTGGELTLKAQSHEALETKATLEISGGVVYGYSASDDGINAASTLTISGGYVCGYSAGNDGIDANGDLYIKGGVVYAVSTKGAPEVALDANTEQRFALHIEGGYVVAIGGIESGSYITNSAYSTTSWSRASWHALYDSTGSAAIAFMTPPSSGNSTMFLYARGSALSLKSGITAGEGGTVFDGSGYIPGTVSGGSTVSISPFTSSPRW